MSEKLFNFTEGHFLSLLKQKVPLDCILLLEMIKHKKDVNSEEFLPYLQRLQRKGYLDTKMELTQYGEALYKSMFEEVVAVKAKKVEKNDDFERWWETYPATNDFEINGKHFQGVQQKRQKKEECKKHFIIACNSYTAEEIINATKYHFDMAKEISFKKKENQLTYIPNSERYLSQKYYESYIEKAKMADKAVKTTGEFEI